MMMKRVLLSALCGMATAFAPSTSLRPTSAVARTVSHPAPAMIAFFGRKQTNPLDDCLNAALDPSEADECLVPSHMEGASVGLDPPFHPDFPCRPAVASLPSLPNPTILFCRFASQHGQQSRRKTRW